MKTALLGVVLVAIGCGGEGAPDYVGEWQSPLNGFNCTRVLGLDDVGTFKLGLACVLNNNAIAVERHQGTYAATGDRLTLNQTRSSCPGDVREGLPFTYSTSPGNLTLTNTDGAIVFAPLPGGPSSGGAVQFGCFDNSLTFTQSPEHDVF